MKSKRRRLPIILLIIGLLTIAALFSYFLSTHGLTVSRFTAVSDKISSPIRIVQLSDLHNAEFGPGNSRLVAKVAKQEPQLILITGDLVDAGENSTSAAESLIRELAAIAPVYISFGNHEAEFEDRYGRDLRECYTAAGGTVLEREWIDIELDGQRIRLGGIYGYCLPEELTEGNKERNKETVFTKAFCDTDRLKLLLCHMPYTWLVHSGLESWDIDFVFSGHVHGGQVRLPLIGGFWAPDQGWFPGREAGLYRSEDGTRTMVLSRGLGSTEKLPRFNNIPELVVLEIKPAPSGE